MEETTASLDKLVEEVGGGGTDEILQVDEANQGAL